MHQRSTVKIKVEDQVAAHTLRRGPQESDTRDGRRISYGRSHCVGSIDLSHGLLTANVQGAAFKRRRFEA